MIDGLYKLQFHTQRGSGTGVIVLGNGKALGGNTHMLFNGTYDLNGNVLSASVAVRRHTPGTPSVFGVDEYTLELSGAAHGETIKCTGAAKEAQGTTFAAELKRMAS